MVHSMIMCVDKTLTVLASGNDPSLFGVLVDRRTFFQRAPLLSVPDKKI